jgi:putative ABC transport system permease protein
MSVTKPNTNTMASNEHAAPVASAPRRRRPGRARGPAAVYQSCRSAMEALRANALRSLLTSLGIIIGVGAVIVMISISEGNTATINQRLSSLSPNELIISPGSATASGGVRQGFGTVQSLTQADADAIAAQIPNLAAVSPIENASGQAVFRNQNWATTVQGVYPNYQQIGNWQVQEGSFFTSADEQSGQAVAVIGQTVADNLFTPLGIDPIGQQIRIDNVPFTVVGVLQAKGATGFGRDADDIIFVPFSAAQQRLTGSQYASSIDVLVNNASNVPNAQNAVQQLLQQRHHITNPANDDFSIFNQGQLLQTAEGVSQTLTVLLVGVAAISLLVGGIGIMNIMLVSVTERTREIGIRMAIGARARDVRTQFLIEALLLSAAGGIVGIILGALGAMGGAHFGGWPFVLDPRSVLLAFCFAALVGIIFGFYPAQRASRLDPIEALRVE